VKVPQDASPVKIMKVMKTKVAVEAEAQKVQVTRQKIFPKIMMNFGTIIQ